MTFALPVKKNEKKVFVNQVISFVTFVFLIHVVATSHFFKCITLMHLWQLLFNETNVSAVLLSALIGTLNGSLFGLSAHDYKYSLLLLDAL